MYVSHSHSCAVNWVVLLVHPSCLQLVLHQVEQRVANLLLIHADNGVRHGKHFYHICCDPAATWGVGVGLRVFIMQNPIRVFHATRLCHYHVLAPSLL